MTLQFNYPYLSIEQHREICDLGAITAWFTDRKKKITFRCYWKHIVYALKKIDHLLYVSVKIAVSQN